MGELIGIGLYTPAEAARLVDVPARKIVRWLKGHSANGRIHAPLWSPQVDLGDGETYLGFHDLMEVRVAAAFIAHGVSVRRIRAAIRLAREIHGHERPLSTSQFRTDGETIFLRVAEDKQPHSATGAERLLEVSGRQYVFAEIIAPSLKGVEFDAQGNPVQWWPNGRRGRVVIDPGRCFGQPIDGASGVPTRILAAAARAEGISASARAYEVAEASVLRALEFEDGLSARRTA